MDALQYLTGGTLGKGNPIHKDYGKNPFTFVRCRDRKAMRLAPRPILYGDAGPLMRKLHHKMQAEGLSGEEEKTWQETRVAVSKRIMDSDLSEVFGSKTPGSPIPKKARILASLTCASCGEPVTETRTRRFNG